VVAVTRIDPAVALLIAAWLLVVVGVGLAVGLAWCVLGGVAIGLIVLGVAAAAAALLVDVDTTAKAPQTPRRWGERR
jgi:hypothetical protein